MPSRNPSVLGQSGTYCNNSFAKVGNQVYMCLPIWLSVVSSQVLLLQMLCYGTCYRSGLSWLSTWLYALHLPAQLAKADKPTLSASVCLCLPFWLSPSAKANCAAAGAVLCMQH